MKQNLALYGLLLLMISSGLISCGNRFNVFSPDQDVAFGQSVRDEILANTFEYTVWNREDYPEPYHVLDSITQEILNTGSVKYKDRFPWELYIIENDEIPNAFCAPGGYIFVYTGLMKYVHTVDELAGVMAHEIAHADCRHSTSQLTKQYGISIILQLILGENGAFIGDLTNSLITLGYSRQNEKEADSYGVTYLCNSGFEADASKRFFQRLSEESGSFTMPTFLSTHPDDGSRVQNIEKQSLEMNCPRPSQTIEKDLRLIRLFLPDYSL